MNSRRRLATVSVLSFLTAWATCWPLHADEQTPGGPFAESLSTKNSAGLPRTAQPSQAEGPQSPADNTVPLFRVVEHGKWGYMDRNGKIVISPEYYDAYPFTEGLALIQPFHVIGSRAIRVSIIDKNGKMVGSKIYSQAQAFSEG